MESNHRPLDYESSVLPLNYPALNFRGYTFPSAFLQLYGKLCYLATPDFFEFFRKEHCYETVQDLFLCNLRF